jgi:hypothetical protein
MTIPSSAFQSLKPPEIGSGQSRSPTQWRSAPRIA